MRGEDTQQNAMFSYLSPEQRRATVDQDATIIESHKQQALPTYEGPRGYQPMLAVWAETGLVLADQFRGGNVPAQMKPLEVAQRAFAVLTPLKRLALPAELLTARPKRLRFLIFNTPGRLVHHPRRLILRLAALAEGIAAYRERMRLLPLRT